MAGVTAALGSASGRSESLLRAAQLWGAAQVLRSALNAPLPPVDIDNYEHQVVAARVQCDAAAFTHAWEEGRSIPLEDAIAEALAIGASTTTIPVTPVSRDSLILLTPREREVAALIAAGHTNRMIATELAISERTVDTHAARILAKLGLTSRTQMRWE